MRALCLMLVLVAGCSSPDSNANDDDRLLGMSTKGFGDVEAVLVRVHDGDTYVVNVPTWPAIIGNDIEVRLDGYDTPELHDKRPAIKKLAEEARDFVKGEMKPGDKIRLVGLGRDKYFRIDATVRVGNQKPIGEQLVMAGLARLYTGDGPKPW